MATFGATAATLAEGSFTGADDFYFVGAYFPGGTITAFEAYIGDRAGNPVFNNFDYALYAGGSSDGPSGAALVWSSKHYSGVGVGEPGWKSIVDASDAPPNVSVPAGWLWFVLRSGDGVQQYCCSGDDRGDLAEFGPTRSYSGAGDAPGGAWPATFEANGAPYFACMAVRVEYTPAVGGEAIEGSLSATLGALTLVAAGTLEVQGSLAVTLAPLTLTAAASLAIDAELDQTLGPLVLESTGQLLNPISGALEVTLGALALHSAGQLSVTGSLEQTLAPLSMVAEGRLEIIASLDRILGDLTLTAEGSLENAIHGALEVVLGELTLAATGSLRITGALDVTLGALVLQAVGSLDGYDSGFYIDGRTEARITEPYGSLTLYSDGEGGFFSIE